ncbi:MAG: hypothetical protein F6K56_32280 [Moorea sp. SIO3G5]|nr:hypothetical protein [Moorena sp. SIO3G5]
MFLPTLQADFAMKRSRSVAYGLSFRAYAIANLKINAIANLKSTRLIKDSAIIKPSTC